MSYSFNPIDEKELDAPFLLEEGVYDFEVAKATKKVSKSGNPMAELQLKVWDKSGKIHTVFDYLVFSEQKLNLRKINHFCKTVGLEEEYKKGNLPEELSNLCGKVNIVIQPEQPKPSGGWYPPKNAVEDYIKSEDSIKKNEIANDEFDDIINF